MAETPTASQPGVQVHDLDPASLIIGPNVRTDPQGQDRALAASIHARGVLEVITAYRDTGENLIVYRGQRRTLIAAQVGTPTGTVPVRVIDEPSEADRIVDQMSENLHRASMSAREVRDGIEQLALAGLSPTTIAKRLATGRAAVQNALTVAGNPTLRDLMDGHDLTLDQAGALAEFEDDPEATSQLLGALEHGHSIEHHVQRLRDARAEAAALETEQDRWRAQGYPVIDRPEKAWTLSLENLLDAQGQPFDPASYASIEGAVLYLEQDWTYPADDPADPADADATDPADADATDDSQGDDQSDDRGEDGEPVATWSAVWVCLDPQAHGYTSRYATHTGDPAAAEKSGAEQAAAAQQRRTVIANNKAWRSAQRVRQTWLAAFVGRRTPPKGAEALIAQAVLTGPAWLNRAMDVNRHSLLRQLFGGDQTTPATAGQACQELADQAAAGTPKRATMLALAAVLAAWQDQADEHTWRHPDPWDAAIVTALAQWGYPLSEVEQLLLTPAIRGSSRAA